ncbi:hypothetical protein SEA_PHETTUCCINE_65 [Streptomyces phage Phettuccine]|uniref:DUF7417 domain-containing protein n=1 Tax=Streptomyces phage Phettuccine TaxID=2656621 RepID=A0A649VI09_9CAUD|nr:hypothetical protein SEA_PHETTUCCINE_65 [Streptomyces phage Phettuccine]
MGRMKDIAIEVMDYEAGNLDAGEILELFAKLIKSGMVWNLQGSYGRTAQQMLDAGLVTPEGEVTDYGWGLANEIA